MGFTTCITYVHMLNNSAALGYSVPENTVTDKTASRSPVTQNVNWRKQDVK